MAEVVFNGQKYSSESDIGKLAAPFEQPHYRPDAPGNQFPRMMYKAQKGPDGLVRCDAGQGIPRHHFQSDAAYEASLRRDEAFNNECRMIVGSDDKGKALPPAQCEAQYKAALESGWRDSAEDAIALVRHYETVVKGTAHLQRLKQEEGMSEAARAEAAAYDASTPDIVTEIPETARVRRDDVVMVGSQKIDKRSKAYKASLKA